MKAFNYPLLVLSALAALVSISVETPAQPAPETVRIDAGSWQPLYGATRGDESMVIDAFYLSRFAVTNGEFLDFVRANPEWRRSSVKRLFADAHYLSHWAGDLELGPAASEGEPVVFVSWFAARAYADWLGMRLPTTAEWEYAASAGQGRPDGRNEAGFYESILRQYSARSGPSKLGERSMVSATGTPANYWGVSGLHDLIWEWVDDFNSNTVTGESRNNTDLDRGLFCGGASLEAFDVSDYAAFIRFAFRSALSADFAVSNLGFRVAADAPARKATAERIQSRASK